MEQLSLGNFAHLQCKVFINIGLRGMMCFWAETEIPKWG